MAGLPVSVSEPSIPAFTAVTCTKVWAARAAQADVVAAGLAAGEAERVAAAVAGPVLAVADATRLGVGVGDGVRLAVGVADGERVAGVPLAVLPDEPQAATSSAIAAAVALVISRARIIWGSS